MKKGICLVGQSGGPTAVINASLLGVIEEVKRNKTYNSVYGCLNGIDGILNENFVDFGEYCDEELCLLKYTPSTALGSVRFKMPDDLNDEIYERIAKIFAKYNVKAFFYIGGNDSMDTCNKLAQFFKQKNSEVKVIGIPKTIDNDMVEIDHTPGFASASKFIATSLMEIYLDTNCYKNGRVTFVEIMGRDSGWLTCASKIATHYGMGPDLIYVPEVPFNINAFLRDVQKIYQQKKKVLIAVSEGIRDTDGSYFLQKRLYNQNDNFGHLQLGGVGLVLGEFVNKELGLPVRSIELNLLQRCSSLTYSKVDIDEAYTLGSEAVKLATKGLTGKLISLKRKNQKKYEVEYIAVNLNDVANYVKEVPLAFINEEHNHITDAYLEYILPLMEGEVEIPYENNFPKFFKLHK